MGTATARRDQEREAFLNHIYTMVGWCERHCHDKRGALEVLAHSILAAMDGAAAGYRPATRAYLGGALHAVLYNDRRPSQREDGDEGGERAAAREVIRRLGREIHALHTPAAPTLTRSREDWEETLTALHTTRSYLARRYGLPAPTRLVPSPDGDDMPLNGRRP